MPLSSGESSHGRRISGYLILVSDTGAGKRQQVIHTFTKEAVGILLENLNIISLASYLRFQAAYFRQPVNVWYFGLIYYTLFLVYVVLVNLISSPSVSPMQISKSFVSNSGKTVSPFSTIISTSVIYIVSTNGIASKYTP